MTSISAGSSDKRVVIITGASSGIGHDLALAAARSGYAVVAVARRKDRLDALALQIASLGGRCLAIEADVTQLDSPRRIVAQALSAFGRIDVLVNNAGAAIGGALLSQSDPQIDGQWQLHVAASLRLTREAFPALRDSNGQAIFIGSGVARVPLPYYGAYCAAKAAMRAMTTQLRRELRGTGVAVTYVDPGTVMTEFAVASGMRPWAPRFFLAKSDYVAKRILHAMRTRPAYFNAVGWQNVVTALGAFFWPMTDLVLSRMTPETAAASTRHPERTQSSLSSRRDSAAVLSEAERSRSMRDGASAVEAILQTDFQTALAPIERRMQRVNLSQAFLRKLLVPGETVRLSDAAMQWAGMPNKNERAVLQEALQALAAAGFLQSESDESWLVLRAAE